MAAQYHNIDLGQLALAPGAARRLDVEVEPGALSFGGESYSASPGSVPARLDVSRTVAGHALLYRRPEGDLRVPEGNIDLAHAEVREELRGRGVGLALTAHVLGWAHDHGYRSMTTDWRSVNLLSSRFWPRRGFRPQYLRLYRAVP